jgi:hypothetical protein
MDTMHLHHNSMDNRSSLSIDDAKLLRAFSNPVIASTSLSLLRTTAQCASDEQRRALPTPQHFSSAIRRLQITGKWQSLDSLASQVVKRQSLCFFSPRAAESFVVTQLQTARWPVPTCADILKPSIDYLTLDKRKRGGWVLGFEFLALSFLNKNESLDVLQVVVVA